MTLTSYEMFGASFGACIYDCYSTKPNCSRSHLLLTRMSKSRALECFVVEVSERSSHMAILVCLSKKSFGSDVLTSSKDAMVYASAPERHRVQTQDLRVLLHMPASYAAMP